MLYPLSYRRTSQQDESSSQRLQTKKKSNRFNLLTY
jgi:hypothetical protein